MYNQEIKIIPIPKIDKRDVEVEWHALPSRELSDMVLPVASQRVSECGIGGIRRRRERLRVRSMTDEEVRFEAC